MTSEKYEYFGMMAETWDLFRGDTSNWEDRKFYLDFIHATGQPVLDVGCGTGRLLLDYHSQGVDIDGVDISPEMLNICRNKARDLGVNVSLYQADMETMRLPRKYRTIIVPSSTFQLVLDLEHARRAITNLYDHLLPAGYLVMPFMLLREPGEPLEHEWELNGEFVSPADGALIRRWSKSHFDPETQLEHNEDRYEVIKDGMIVSSEHHLQSPATRQYSQRQAFVLFSQTGFVDLRIYKGFSRKLATLDDMIFTVCGIKP